MVYIYTVVNDQKSRELSGFWDLLEENGEERERERSDDQTEVLQSVEVQKTTLEDHYYEEKN